MHGQYIRNMDQQLISEEDTFLWLLRGDLKGDNDSAITAAQCHALQTKYHATKILHTETDSKSRLCKEFDETVEHITSACKIMAKAQYIKRVCAQLLFNTCRERGKIIQQTLVRPCTKIS